MTTLNNPPAYLSKHYVYELNMLRWTHAMLAGTTEGFTANALIESFCVHARALMDFYKSVPRQDDVVAIHFISAGQFSATTTAQALDVVRGRVNKQIAHLTAGRESPLQKVDSADRQALLNAVEIDHAAFKLAVDSQYANCFTDEKTFTATVLVTGSTPASATNHVQFLSTTI